MSIKPYTTIPDLSDQHWRASLPSRKPADIDSDVEAAIKDRHMWRFKLLMQADMPEFQIGQYFKLVVEHDAREMLDVLAARHPDWQQKFEPEQLATIAATHGHLPLVKYFINDLGVDPHASNEQMLRSAAEKGHLAVVDYLITLGADVTVYGDSALNYAGEEGHLDVMKSLVAAGGDIQNHGGSSMVSAAGSNRVDIIQFLYDHGVRDNLDDALCKAAARGHVDAVDRLLKLGADAKCSDDPLYKALFNNHYDAADRLIIAGADVNSNQGEHVRNAIFRSDADTLRFLMMHNANLNIVHQGDTPLMLAASSGTLEITALLLSNGADHRPFQFGAVRAAIGRHDRDIAKILFAHDKKFIERQKKIKYNELVQTFGDNYSLDDLRQKRGASGETGLLIAAQTGQFADIIKGAKGGNDALLKAADMYHPDDSINSVYYHLKRTRSLQQFFQPAFWMDRLPEVQAVHAELPPAAQKKVSLAAIAQHLNYRALQKKAKNLQLKPPSP